MIHFRESSETNNHQAALSPWRHSQIFPRVHIMVAPHFFHLPLGTLAGLCPPCRQPVDLCPPRLLYRLPRTSRVPCPSLAFCWFAECQTKCATDVVGCRCCVDGLTGRIPEVRGDASVTQVWLSAGCRWLSTGRAFPMVLVSDTGLGVQRILETLEREQDMKMGTRPLKNPLQPTAAHCNPLYSAAPTAPELPAGVPPIMWPPKIEWRRQSSGPDYRTE